MSAVTNGVLYRKNKIVCVLRIKNPIMNTYTLPYLQLRESNEIARDTQVGGQVVVETRRIIGVQAEVGVIVGQPETNKPILIQIQQTAKKQRQK